MIHAVLDLHEPTNSVITINGEVIGSTQAELRLSSSRYTELVLRVPIDNNVKVEIIGSPRRRKRTRTIEPRRRILLGES